MPGPVIRSHPTFSFWLIYFMYTPTYTVAVKTLVFGYEQKLKYLFSEKSQTLKVYIFHT